VDAAGCKHNQIPANNPFRLTVTKVMDPAVSLDRSSYTGKAEVASAEDDGSDETAGDPLGLSQQKIKSTKVGRCANISKSNGHLSQDVQKGNVPKPVLSGTSEPDVCGSSSNE
jgi:hypothetical protein